MYCILHESTNHLQTFQMRLEVEQKSHQRMTDPARRALDLIRLQRLHKARIRMARHPMLIGPLRCHEHGKIKQDRTANLTQVRKTAAPTVRDLQRGFRAERKSQILERKISVRLRFMSIWTAASLRLSQNQNTQNLNIHVALSTSHQPSLLCPPRLSTSAPGL